MSDLIEIRGGAGEFEAAVVAVVLDRITQEESAVGRGRTRRTDQLPAWVRALGPEEPETPREMVTPS